MSEWVCANIKPPTCMSVALYVIQFHEPDLKYLWCDEIHTGFWDEEREDWFLDVPEHIRSDWFPKIEDETTKVICWTLLKQKPVFSYDLVEFLYKD